MVQRGWSWWLVVGAGVVIVVVVDEVTVMVARSGFRGGHGDDDSLGLGGG